MIEAKPQPSATDHRNGPLDSFVFLDHDVTDVRGIATMLHAKGATK